MPKARIYNWEAWFEQGSFIAQQGVDFFCGIGVFVQQARTAAHELRYHLRVVEEPGSRSVQLIARKKRREREGKRATA